VGQVVVEANERFTRAVDTGDLARNERALSAAFLLLVVPCAWAQDAPTSMAAAATHVQVGDSAPQVAVFTDVTSELGLHFKYVASHTSRKYLIETMGSGVALFDYDNDGRLDIFVVNGAPLSDPTPKGTIPQKTDSKDWNRLYHQKRDGTFEDVTEKAGLQGMGYGMGVAVGDYDNDGFEDLYVTAYGGNRLYHNNGDGTFTDVTEKAGVGGSGWSTSAAWVDLDGDGLLDLVVLRYLQWDFDDTWCGERREGYRAYCHPDGYRAIAPLVYHNDGNGHFTEISHKVGLAEPGKGLGIALADYDRDGHLDIFVANDSMPEFLYHNKGDGTFEEVALRSGVAVDGEGHTYAGMGVDFADYNNDGLPDLVVTALASQMYALYRNNGDGTFTYDSYPSGLGRMTMKHSGWGVRFLDYDNDGWKGLLINQGHDLDTVQLTFPDLRFKEPMLLAKNTGKGFVDISVQAGEIFQKTWVGRGLAIGDIDNDPEPLVNPGTRRAQKQSRCDRGGSKTDDCKRVSVGHRDDRRQLSFFERQTCTFWPGTGNHSENHRYSLAERDSSDDERCSCGSNPQSRGTIRKAERKSSFTIGPDRPHT
jgi:hypothetical protein